ncbi:MAG: STAS/SEC14 domain-containing protein [Cytophagales bacterium]|nr:MAG: STAS/SEC14 domain-containing protein [Cytophagales bacterium]
MLNNFITLEDSQYCTIGYNTKSNILFTHWKEATAKLTDELYKELSKRRLDFLAQYKSNKILTDTQKFYFTVSPELQAWVAEHTLKTMQIAGVKKIAIIVSEEFIASLSIEQTMEEPEAKPFQTRYFGTQNEAIEWLEETNAVIV